MKRGIFIQSKPTTYKFLARLLARQHPLPDFTWRVDQQGVLVIIDLDLGNQSVTNGVETVIEFIRQDIGEEDMDSLRAVIYRDSMGCFDGLNVVRGVFNGFYSLNCELETEAISKALARAAMQSSKTLLTDQLP